MSEEKDKNIAQGQRQPMKLEMVSNFKQTVCFPVDHDRILQVNAPMCILTQIFNLTLQKFTFENVRLKFTNCNTVSKFS